MSYKKRILGLEIYNPVSRHESPRAMQQYRLPDTAELTGETLEIWLDGRDPFVLWFLDDENLQWARVGEPFRLEKYEATKADDTTYMIKFMLSGKRPANCVTVVWDKLTNLVTCVLASVGEDPHRPKLVTSKVYFGAVKKNGVPLSTDRHGFTKELIGRRVIWRYNQTDEVCHCYCGENYFRLGQSEKVLAEGAPEHEIRHYEYLTGRVTVYPYYEEPAYYIKIKDGMYLYSVVEDNINRLLPDAGGGQMLMILNTAGPRYIGRSFGVGANDQAESQFIGAIGTFCDEPDEVELLPYPIYSFED